LYQKFVVYDAVFLLVSDFYLSLQQDFIVSTFVMDNWNIRQEGSTLYISLEYELTVFNSPALQDELEKWPQSVSSCSFGNA